MPLEVELSQTGGVSGHACHKTSGAFRDIALAKTGEPPCLQYPSFRRRNCDS
jgi:hypothetical protein